ncbi:DUF460 domain-containing protein [Candidatus Woesearchaeota archaeon]|nr:DUF460 domain-containing protein [Candidatus Woesearchaeota archaeon]
MNPRPLLIVGIDPGTTVGIACLALDGNVLLIASGKHWGPDDVVKRISDLGKALAIGTDKAKVPELVSHVAAILSAKTFAPNADLTKVEKAEMVSERCANEHEADALAAARVAYGRIEPLVKRIKLVLQRTNKHYLYDRVTPLVILHTMSIRAAISYLEQPATPEARLVSKVIERKERSEEDYVTLYNQLQGYRAANESLKMRVEALEHALSKPAPIPQKRDIKDRRIAQLSRTLQDEKQHAAFIQKRASDIEELLIVAQTSVIIKKIPDLRWETFAQWRRAAKLTSGDVVLVENTDRASGRALEELRKSTQVIVVRGPASPELRDFIALNAIKLKLHETPRYALADRDLFEKTLAEARLVENVVESYRSQRTQA